MRRFCLVCLLASSLSLEQGVPPSQAAPPARGRPDIVLFISDDHGVLDSEPYGATDVRTPNLRKLAGAGLTFTHAFVASPSCAPSRAALLTGLMPARNGAEANHTFPRIGLPTLPGLLRELGYEVVSFGKVAHGPEGTKRAGFSHSSPRYDARTVEQYLAGRERRRPLCLMVGTRDPHVPWPENRGYDPAALKLPPTHVDTPETRDQRARYYTAVTRADELLGEIRALAERYLNGKNLLFLYTSDHGAQWPFGKWTLYDAGIHVPLLAAWPGVIRPGTTTGALVSTIDLLPTLVELAGGRPPTGIDGRSLVRVLRGETATHRDHIFATHSGDGDWNVYPARVLRTRDYAYLLNLHPEFAFTTHIDQAKDKDGLIYWRSWEARARTDPKAAAVVRRYRQRPAEELYDLVHDPYQQHNLAADPSQAERLADFRGQLRAWMKAQNDAGTVFGRPRLLTKASAAAVGPRGKRPNIIFILADDLGWADLGCYGNRFNETPQVDRLAAGGIRFTQGYACPVCSPTRASLMTGQYPCRLGINDYLGPGHAGYLSPKVMTVPRRLKTAGYVSALIGKWHLTGDYDKAPGSPDKHGWDEVICSETRYIGSGSYFFPYRHLPDVKTGAPGEYLTDRLNAEALAFIRRHQDKPFFLYLAHYAPHTKLAGKPDLVEHFAAKPGAARGTVRKPNNPILAAMLASIDDGVGRIVALLDELKLAEDTVVIFASDNGGEATVTVNGVLRGGKSMLYEGGIRVPLIVRWPGHVPAGKRCDVPVAVMDFYPTLLDLAGVRPDPSQTVDGVSLRPLLIDGKEKLTREALYWHYPLDKPHFLGGRSSGAVRQGDWKLIEFYDTHSAVLYDLAHDVGEEHDLTQANPEKAAALRTMLDRWRQSVGAKVPTRPSSKP